MKTALDSVASLLSIQVFPNITVGTLIFIPLAFAVLLFILPLKKGVRFKPTPIFLLFSGDKSENKAETPIQQTQTNGNQRESAEES